MKRFFAPFLLFTSFFLWSCAPQNNVDTVYTANTGASAPIVILHTNDVHGGIDDHIGYAGLKAYKDTLEAKYGDERVILVDAGDAIQGSSIAMLTQGGAVIDLMNAVGYDYFVPGNHEFDYQMPRHFALMKRLEAKVISVNFIRRATQKPVYPAYDMYTVNGNDSHDGNDIHIAFVGVSTPESLTKAKVQTFQDDQGRLLYSFLEDSTGGALYEGVQQSVDAARAAGAEYVVALVHLGIEESAHPWRSTDLIAHVQGIDVVIDGHSHSVIEGEVHKDKAGERVILSQTGTKLQYIGQIVIDPSKPDGAQISAALISKEAASTKQDADVAAMVTDIQDEFAKQLEKKVAYTPFELVMRKDPLSARNGETNLGNLVTDAYRALLGTQVGISNGGGIRVNMAKGEITYQHIIDVHPFSNSIMSVEVSGKTLKDALEMGARNYPSAEGGFLQVSGMTYEIDASIPSSVKVDDRDNFLSVDGAYRVKNIFIDKKPLDERAHYTLASSEFLLKGMGDGMSMFKGAKVLQDMFMTDSDVLITYITKHLKGRIPQRYARPEGEGRIVIR